MRKLILTLILTAAVLTALPAGTVRADGEDVAYLSANAYYDYSTRMFVHTVPEVNNAEVFSNVTDGMFTNGPVSVQAGVAFNLQIYRNGIEVTDETPDNLTIPGTYVVKLYSVDVPVQVMKFTIIGKTTSVTRLQVPADFVISAVYRNGEDIIDNNSEVLFNEEGEYIVEYTCISTNISYSCNVTLDLTPPVLALTNVSDGVAKGAVSLADCEPGATLSIAQDGVQYIPNGYELTQTGHYFVRITDVAGNYTDYEFDIVAHLDTISILFLVIFFLMIGALGVYMITQRKKMRVR